MSLQCYLSTFTFSDTLFLSLTAKNFLFHFSYKQMDINRIIQAIEAYVIVSRRLIEELQLIPEHVKHFHKQSNIKKSFGTQNCAAATTAYIKPVDAGLIFQSANAGLIYPTVLGR